MWVKKLRCDQLDLSLCAVAGRVSVELAAAQARMVHHRCQAPSGSVLPARHLPRVFRLGPETDRPRAAHLVHGISRLRLGTV